MDGFPNCIFPYLNVTETFGSNVGGPKNACTVVIVDNGCGGTESGQKVHIFKDVADVENVFGAFVGGINFCFGGASGCDCLSFRSPVKGAIEPLDVVGHGSGVEEREIWRLAFD